MTRLPGHHRSRRAAAAGALLALALVGGCSSSPDTTGPASTATATITEAGAHLAPGDFAQQASTQGTTILDVRTPEEYASGHLPGAVNVDVSATDFTDRLSAYDASGTYAVYCQSGRRSAIALQKMQDLGYVNAYDLAGGISSWVAAGGPVVTGG